MLLGLHTGANRILSRLSSTSWVLFTGINKALCLTSVSHCHMLPVFHLWSIGVKFSKRSTPTTTGFFLAVAGLRVSAFLLSTVCWYQYLYALGFLFLMVDVMPQVSWLCFLSELSYSVWGFINTCTWLTCPVAFYNHVWCSTQKIYICVICINANTSLGSIIRWCTGQTLTFLLLFTSINCMIYRLWSVIALFVSVLYATHFPCDFFFFLETRQKRMQVFHANILERAQQDDVIKSVAPKYINHRDAKTYTCYITVYARKL